MSMIPEELSDLPSLLPREEASLEVIKTFAVESKKDIREWITNLATLMLDTDGFTDGSELPLKHTFSNGFYIRELLIPKGYLVVGVIHKYAHPWFMLKGDISELTTTGIIRIKAPYYGITLPGTQRVGYAHEDTIWATVHTTDCVDEDKVLDTLRCVTYEEFEEYQEQLLRRVA